MNWWGHLTMILQINFPNFNFDVYENLQQTVWSNVLLTSSFHQYVSIKFCFIALKCETVPQRCLPGTKYIPLPSPAILPWDSRFRLKIRDLKVRHKIFVVNWHFKETIFFLQLDDGYFSLIWVTNNKNKEVPNQCLAHNKSALYFVLFLQSDF